MKHIFLFLFAIFISTPLMANDNPMIDRAQAWLSNLDTAQSRFEQIDYLGNVMRGTFYINRPGRLRFEYDQPIKDYIVADGYLIHFYDGESGQVSSGPIGSTLADFILRDNGGFDDKVKVESVREKNGMVNIAVSQADQPGMGELILNFSKDPFALKSWRIIDAQGLTTDIILTDMQRDVKIDPRLFKMNNRKMNN